MFREEHDVINENVSGSLERNEWTALIFLDESPHQFEEMTVEEDVIRALDDKKHKERETLWLNVLL